MQAALEASRDQYSSNEELMKAQLDEKEADRLELGRVVQELQEEIDRCQLKLDKEAKEQAREKKIAQEAAALLELELEKVKAEAAGKDEELESEICLGVVTRHGQYRWILTGRKLHAGTQTISHSPANWMTDVEIRRAHVEEAG